MSETTQPTEWPALPPRGHLHIAETRGRRDGDFEWACRCGQTGAPSETREEARSAGDEHLAGANTAPSTCSGTFTDGTPGCGRPVTLAESGTDEFIASHLCPPCLHGSATGLPRI